MGFARTRRRNRAILGNSGAILGDSISLPGGIVAEWSETQGAYILPDGRQYNGSADFATVQQPLFKSEADTALYWAGQGVEIVLPGWDAARAQRDPAGYAAALASFKSQNSGAIATVTQQVQTRQANDLAAANVKSVATNAAQLDIDAAAAAGKRKFADELTSDDLKSSPDYLRGMLTRAEWIEDFKSVARGGQPNNAIKFKDRIPAGAIVQQNVGNFQTVLDQIQQAGGNINVPTQLIDEMSGQPIAVLQRTTNGTMISVPQTVNVDLFSRVTGFLDTVAGKISDASTQVQKINNAAKGAAAGAKAGYSAPTDWKPLLLGGGALAVLFLISRKR